MALLAGAMREVRHDSCTAKQNHARTSRRKGSESRSWGVAVFLAKKFYFFIRKMCPQVAKNKPKQIRF